MVSSSAFGVDLSFEGGAIPQGRLGWGCVHGRFNITPMTAHRGKSLLLHGVGVGPCPMS
jgi:hypothetical protein